MTFGYIWLLILLFVAGMPVVFALLVAPGLSLLLDGEIVFHKALLSRLYNGMDSFPLMALPFFVLAGQLMNAGGITRSIVDFSQSMIGHVRGGLAQVNVCSSLLFAGLSGSAVADASALGKIFVPAMTQAGYGRLCGGDYRGLGGHWSHSAAIRDYDSLCLHHECFCGGSFCCQHRAWIADCDRINADGLLPRGKSWLSCYRIENNGQAI